MTYDIEAEVRRRTRRVVVIAVAVVIVLLAGASALVVWARSRPGNGPDPHAIATPAISPAPPTSPAAGPEPGTLDALGAVTWADVRGMAVPVSARFGPSRQRAGLASGFSHDQAGAVLAAAHIALRADAIVGPAVYKPTITGQVTGVDADALIGNVDSDYERRRAAAGVNPGDPLPVTNAKLGGYRIESYTAAAASLRLLISSPGRDAQGTVLVDFRLEVRWLSGDWRLLAPPGGDWRAATGQVTSATGYTPFPPRR